MWFLYLSVKRNKNLKDYQWDEPITTRLQGRPKSRWDDVKQDICKIKIKN